MIGTPPPPLESSGANVGAIVGGIVGGIAALVAFTITISVLIMIIVKRRKGSSQGNRPPPAYKPRSVRLNVEPKFSGYWNEK